MRAAEVASALPTGTHTAAGRAIRSGEHPSSCNSLLRLRGGGSGTGGFRFSARNLLFSHHSIHSTRITRTPFLAGHACVCLCGKGRLRMSKDLVMLEGRAGLLGVSCPLYRGELSFDHK